MDKKIDFNNLNLNKDFILSKVSEKQIFDFYINKPYKLGELLKSNLRGDDDTNSLNVFMRNNELRYKDFGHSYGNCFEYVKNLFKCDYRKAMQIIANDFNIVPGAVDKTIKPDHSFAEDFMSFQKVIVPVKRGWKLLDKQYWTDRYYIPIDLLLEYEINAANYIYLKNKPDNMFIWGHHLDDNPIYYYKLDNAYKVYRPFSAKKGKWLSTTKEFDIQGLKQLPKKGELLIITSSMKDVLVLKVLGYDAIALGGEGNNIPDKILDYLYTYYDNIIIFYDNDEPGLKYGQKMAENVSGGYIHIPLEYKEKDISDFIHIHRIDNTIDLMRKLI